VILVDTSIWIDHLRRGNKDLVALLKKVEVVTHPFVIGELSCGNLKNRKAILALLDELPKVTIAEHEEVLGLVESRKLMGNGIGWMDAHLLASSLLSGTPLWTADRKLRSLSAIFGMLY
jgi:predicted nucleic acid-binding protein